MQEIHTKTVEVVTGSQFGWSGQAVCLGSKRERISSPDLK